MSDVRYTIVMPEEVLTTPPWLYRVSFFTALAFVGMALLSSGEFRIAILLSGAFIIALLLIAAAWIRFLGRYGRATLFAKDFQFGERWEGVIDTELQDAPRDAVHVTVFGYRAGSYTVGFGVTDVVDASRFGRTARGGVQIPFGVDLPGKDLPHAAEGLRITVRTKWWPAGWGAEFVIPY